MPDFEALVRQRLGSLKLSREGEREVVAELAAHLEDRYLQLLAGGAGGPEALADSLQELKRSRSLRRNIRRAKEDWMDRSRQLLMPALASMCVSGVAQLVCNGLYPHPFVFPTGDTGYVLQPLWLAALPLAGALAAYLARKAGATRGRRLAAACAPVLVLLPLFALGMIVDFRSWHTKPLLLLAGPILSWLVIPAIPLLLGALPFVLGTHPSEAKPSAAATA